MKVRRLSQRALANRAAVSHATISRLLSGRSKPSLATATRISEAVRSPSSATSDTWPPRGEEQPPAYPIVGVEYALRSDEGLAPPDVRKVMKFYLAVRRQKRTDPPPTRIRRISR